MFFLLKYLNLKFSNKFRSVPLSPNIIDMSIYYSITISTPWFIQTDIIFTGEAEGADKAGPEGTEENVLKNVFYSELGPGVGDPKLTWVELWMLLHFFYWEPQVHNKHYYCWFRTFRTLWWNDICKQFLAVRDDKKMIEFYFWICWCGRQDREGLGFYKTLIRMYPWDIMVIGPGNTSPTHTLEYLVRL